MRVGLFTDGLAERPLAGALEWLVRELPEVRDVEVGTGGYSPAPHADRARLLADEDARAAWLETIEGPGFRLAALNVSGNPLEVEADDLALRETIRLAALLGVDRVVCMSGGDPRLAGGGWFPGVEDETARYWDERVVPFWRSLVADAQMEHPDLRLCFELEPGSAVYNVSTFERVAELGDNLALNLDPSHFFWQEIDPLAVIRRLGARVAFAHGKDTVLRADAVELDGLLDRSTWSYATVGTGHDSEWWSSFAEELGNVGYDGVVSIEVEDPHVPAEEAILRSARVLEQAIAAVRA
jgi:sugar phosphate isomerase/epimerase